MNAQLPTVRWQTAAIKVDVIDQSWSGHTEVYVAAPPASAAAGGGATLGLHCYSLRVQSVTINGQPAAYEVQAPVREELPEAVTAAAYESPQRHVAAVAESAFYLYERQLQRERQPELSIRLPPAVSSSKGEELCIRVEFSGGGGTPGPAPAGLHFAQRYAVTDAQVRRASAWLPCVDTPAAAVRWPALDITCRGDEVVVGPGQLQRQSWAEAGRLWRTFHYSLPIAAPPCQLAFAVGPFRVLATSAAAAKAGGGKQQAQTGGGKQLTHFAPQQQPKELAVAAVLAAPPLVASAGAEGQPGSGSSTNSASDGLARSAHFFGLVWGFYEEVLGTRCPLPAMQQAFLPPELLLGGSEGQLATGLQLLSTGQLIQPRAIEQSIAARCAMARSLARQWFGVLLRAATPLDEWLVEGLSGWLEEQYVRRYLGRNELAYRRWRERQAIFLADNGEAPPLAARGLSVPSPWGPLYGTERFDPSQLWATKATAVVGMLERRAGEELFRKHVATVVAGGLAALAAESQPASGTSLAKGASTGAAPSASGPPAPSPLKEAGSGDGGSAGPTGSRLLDTMAFLNDLGRAGSFRREMAPFAARWIYGRGVPHVTAAFIYHSRISALELALKQTGSESAKRAADIAQRAAVTEGSNAGIIKAVVREGDTYTDHPVHLGGEAFVLAELKVTPPVEKKQPGRRTKKKEEEEAAAAAAAEDPVRWVRLDPAGELLCDIRLLQPERMLASQLLHSADVVAQADAIQRLGELRVAAGDGLRAHLGLEALRKTLADRKVFYRVRCDAALALAGLRDEEGAPAGLPALLDFYRRSYFLPSADGSEPATPRSVAIADPSEYFVAQAVVTAVSLCRESDGTTPVDVLLFLSTCLQDYSSAPGAPFSDYGLVAAMCAALGNLQYPGFGDTLLTLLEKFLERDAVLVSPGSAIGCACLLAMAALCANGTCDEDETARVASAVQRVRQSPGLPVPLRHAALAAALQVAAAQGGPAAALQLALAGVPGTSGGQGRLLQLPSLGTPAFLLEEALQLVAAATSSAAPSSAAAAAFEQQLADGMAAGAGALPLALPLLCQLASLLSAGQDCRVRHLAFVLLQLSAAQPPTLYRPPAGEAEEAAALFSAAAAGGPAVSHGATHRTGQQQASGAAAAAAPKIRLQLGGGGGGAKSVAFSGASGPALSGEGPAVSDARALSHGAVEQQPELPGAAQGQMFSPAWAAGGAPGPFAGGIADDVSSRQQQQHPEAVPAFEQHPRPAAPAPAAPAPKFRLKVAQGGGAQQAPPAAAAPSLPLQGQPQPQQPQQQRRSRTPSPGPGGAPGGAPAGTKRKTPDPAAAPVAAAPVVQQQQAAPAPLQQQPFQSLPVAAAPAPAVAAPPANWFAPQPVAAPGEALGGFLPPAAAPAAPPAAPAAAPAGAAKPVTKFKLKFKPAPQ